MENLHEKISAKEKELENVKSDLERRDTSGLFAMKKSIEDEINALKERARLDALFQNEGKGFIAAVAKLDSSKGFLQTTGERLSDLLKDFESGLDTLFDSWQDAKSYYGQVEAGLDGYKLSPFLEDGSLVQGDDRDKVREAVGLRLQSCALIDPVGDEVMESFSQAVRDLKEWRKRLTSRPANKLLTLNREIRTRPKIIFDEVVSTGPLPGPRKQGVTIRPYKQV